MKNKCNWCNFLIFQHLLFSRIFSNLLVFSKVLKNFVLLIFLCSRVVTFQKVPICFCPRLIPPQRYGAAASLARLWGNQHVINLYYHQQKSFQWNKIQYIVQFTLHYEFAMFFLINFYAFFLQKNYTTKSFCLTEKYQSLQI